MKIRGTDFVMYPVSDLARAASFYRDILGLTEEVYHDSEDGGWAEYNCGNLTLALNPDQDLPEVITGGVIALAVDDIHAAHEEMKKRGVRIVMEPQDNSVCWGMQILDPDGNPLILHTRADGTFGQDPEGEQGTAPKP